MAKTKVNKSQLIRDMLKADPAKTPAEIAEALAAKGVKVSSQFVSTIKGNAKRKAGVKAGRKKAKRAGGNEVGNGMVAINAAVEFVKAAGGIEAARAALGTVEAIKNL